MQDRETAEAAASDLVKDYVVHVGFAKCGSTFLQQYFRDHPQVEMVNRKQNREALVVANDLSYDPSRGRTFFAEGAREAKAQNRQVIYSNERLVGQMHSGHFDMQTIATRLAAVFEAPRIILMIRNQMTLIASIYRQYLKVGGAKKLEQMMQPGDLTIPGFDWRAYEFHRVVQLYYRHFGHDRVLVIPLESLAAEGEVVLRRVCELCSIDYEAPESPEPRNVGIEDSCLELRRRLNIIFRPKIRNLRDTEALSLSRDGYLFSLAGCLERSGLFRDQNRDLVAEVRSLLGQRYKDSNRKLGALIGTDMASLGYDT